ncbi:MAG: DUF480 domain-containing protein [Planctomycetaceae bacterium]
METAPQAVTPEIDAEKSTVRQLTRAQRRVLGVLVEKAFTTPEYYPLTLKAVTTGCNQKSNRSPITNYSEDAVEESLDELRKLGLAAVVHTESGRTERYRHFMRQRYPFTEPQLAVITELLLRGRQQLGELRSRASRMVPIDSLDDLRADLQTLTDQGYIQSNGPLERRGIEVDHTFHEPHEGPVFDRDAAPAVDEEIKPSAAPSSARQAVPAQGSSAGSTSAGETPVSVLTRECSELRDGLHEARQEMDAIRERVAQLSDELAELRRALGA